MVEADQETRARISGMVVAQTDVMLIHAAQPWRADWISSGLYDDGWTRPGRAVRIRVFAVPSATTPELRGLTVGIRGPDDGRSRPVTMTSNYARWHGSTTASTTWGAVSVCVPVHGYADVISGLRPGRSFPAISAPRRIRPALGSAASSSRRSRSRTRSAEAAVQASGSVGEPGLAVLGQRPDLGRQLALGDIGERHGLEHPA